MNEFESFFNISKKDLEASKVLYEKKLYPQAIFHLQQSIEKSAKSFFVMIGIANTQDLINKIGHNPIKVINLLIKKEKEIQENREILIKEIPELKDSYLYKEEENKISELDLKSPAELKNLSREMIASNDRIIKEFNSINQIKNQTLIYLQNLKNTNIEDLIGSHSLEEFIRVSRLIINKYPMNEKYNKLKNREDILRIISFTFHNTIIILYLFISLLILSLITLIGATDSRYPNLWENTIPEDIFDINTPIIKEFEKAIEIQEDNLKFLESLHKNLEKIKEYYNK